MENPSDAAHAALWAQPDQASKDATIDAFVLALRAMKERMDRDVIPDACPSCGGKDLKRIYYVRIPPGSMMLEAARGKLVIAKADDGPPGAPTVECGACKHRSGSRAG